MEGNKNEETTEHKEAPSWPTPNDPEWADASEQTRNWLEATQPDALAERMSETIRTAFHAASNLAMIFDCMPEGAWDNALAVLPDDRATILREQLEFAKTFRDEQHATRGSAGNLSDNLFSLAMKDARLINATTHAVD